ncbi:MAG: PAS domain S-box protein [Bacteroidota bacterium]
MSRIIIYGTHKEYISRIHSCINTFSCTCIPIADYEKNNDNNQVIYVYGENILTLLPKKHNNNDYHILLLKNSQEINSFSTTQFTDFVSLDSSEKIICKKIKLYLSLSHTSVFEHTQNYMTLVEQFEDSVILLNNDNTVVNANSHFCTISKYSKEEIYNTPIHTFFPNADFSFSKIKTDSESILLETTLSTKDNTSIPKEIRISKIHIHGTDLRLVIARDIRERLKTLEKLAESEERFRAVIKHTPNGMIIFKNNIISYINLRGTEILEGTYEDFIDQPFSKLIPEAHKNALFSLMEHSDNSTTSRSDTISLTTKTNREVWVNISCVLINVQEEIHHVVIFQDITEQRKTQYDLENKDYRLREIQKIAKLGHWENNIIKHNLYWSDEVYKIYGVTPKTFKPTYDKVLNFSHPDDRDSVKNAYKNSLITQDPYEIVHRIVLKNGTIKYVNEKCSTMFDEQGNPLRSLGTVMDITHTIKTEKALKQTEEKFQLLFENLDQPFLICKPKYNEQNEVFDFIITELNPACKILFHGDYIEVKKRTILELFHDPHFWIEKYKKALETSETITFRKYSTDLHKFLDVVLYPVKEKHQVAGIFTDVSQKVYAENKLQQLTRRLQQIQEYAKIGFYDVNIVTHHSKWSNVMLNIFEYSSNDEQSFETYLNRIHPDDRERVKTIYAQSIKEHKTYENIEYRLLFPNGRIKHIYTEFINTFKGKTCLKTEGWLQDISDLRIAISALRESEEKLRMVTSGTKLGLWEWDLENKDFNLDYIGSSMIGYLPEEIWGDESIYLSLVHDDDKEGLLKYLKRFWRGSSQLFTAEFRVKKKMGRHKWIYSVGIASEYNEKGLPKKMIGFNQDISSRKKVESDLRDSENKFRRIFEIENDSLFLIDSKTHEILEINNAAENLYGYSRKELLKRNFYSLSTNPQRLYSYISEKHSRIDEELALQKSGKTCPVEISLAYFIWKNKRVILAAIRDVSERNRFERELVDAKEKAEESDRLKSAFLANMSHEIRTPLNAIVGFSRLLARKNYEKEKRTLFIQDIQSNSNQLLTIINDILDISKIESGQFILNPEPLCLNKLLQEVYDSFMVQISQKEISFFCEKPLSDSSVNINIDEVRLKQVLNNLLHNAYKFTEKGVIHFGYSHNIDSHITLFVKDTGIGIAPEKHTIIFEHFRQEDDTTTRKYGGTGLGLSISKRLIELMGGTIWVESEKGKGAQFYLQIPFTQIISESEKDETLISPTPTNTNFSGEQILVCDDYTSSYIFISEMFEHEDITVLQAKSGEEGVAMCTQNKSIQLVLMDIQMKGLNGVEAMHIIKKRRPNLPIIAQTAFAQKGDKERFLTEGFDDYITKPLDERELQSIITRFLKKKR